MSGLIHLYCGEGKGKTTAALGLMLRAFGQGMRVLLVQFMKGRDTGELHSLEHLPGVIVMRLAKEFGFFVSAGDQDRIEIAKQNNVNLDQAIRLVGEGMCDLLILDEICSAYSWGAVDKKKVDSLILNKPDGLELVLTGRNAPSHFILAADYVTEFVKRKHPYDSGIPARKGIEF